MGATRYMFGAFVLDAGAYALRRDGEQIHLERLPMELLLLLVSRPDDLVTREEIVLRLWGPDVFLDTDTAINVAIRKVRQALEDSLDKPRYIRTVPAKGYQFIAEVTRSDPGRAAATSPAIASPETSRVEATGAAPRKRRFYANWALAGTVLLFVGVTLGFVFLQHRAHSARRVMFAVLPFVNMTGKSDQEYVADGMTEEIIAQIGSLSPQEIGVIARTSAMRFKGTAKDAKTVARELGADYLLEGSVRESGERVRVTAQLISAQDQTHIWAEDYDRSLSDLLGMESEIASAIATQVMGRLIAPAHQPGAVAAEAETSYLLGLAASNERTAESLSRAARDFREAIERDPGYAQAYVALARCYVISPVFGVGDPLQMMPKARELAKQALSLNARLPAAHVMLAMVAAHYDLDWTTAEREFQTALRLNPSDADAHFFYSNSYLSPHQHHDEAIAEMKRAIALDPLSPAIRSFLIRTYVWAGRDAEARQEIERVRAFAPNLAVLHERAARLRAQDGDMQGAIEEDERARVLSGESAEQAAAARELQERALKSRGAEGYWEAQLTMSAQMPQPPESYQGAFGTAVLLARLGRVNAALDSLDEAFRRRDFHLTEIGIEPAFKSLYVESRFQELLARTLRNGAHVAGLSHAYQSIMIGGFPTPICRIPKPFFRG